MKTLLFEKYIGAHEKEIDFLLTHIKPEDQAEADLINGEEMTREAMIYSLRVSDEAYFVKGESGNPIWVFGIGKEKTERGHCIWLVGTEEAYQYKKEFLIYSKDVVENWKRRYGKLYNCIPKTYKKALRWVEYLGATFLDEVDLPKGKVVFYSIE